LRPSGAAASAGSRAGAVAAASNTRPSEPARTVHVIGPARPGLLTEVRELWQYRGLVYFLARRDIRVRYAQTLFGAAWAVLQPLLNVLIFTLVFGRFAGIPSDGAPYALFAFAGLTAWTFLANGVAASSNSLVSNPNLLTKVYFPRLVIPFGTLAAGMLDFAIAFVLLLVLIAASGTVPLPWSILAVPLSIAGLVLTAAGVGCWLSALNVRYRDIRHVTPFLLQAWLFASPIIYPTSLVPESFRLLLALNPLTGIIEVFRAALLGTSLAVPLWVPAVSALSVVFVFVSGVIYFVRTQSTFADVV
jgi:lipopolysaccharide transport system permease protein